MSLPRISLLSAALLLAAGNSVHAADLMQAYTLARDSDPQLAIADTTRQATQLRVTQSRANLLPSLSGSVGYSRSGSENSGARVLSVDPPIISTSDSRSHSSGRTYNVQLNQSLYNHGNYTQLRAAKKRTEVGEAQFDAENDNLIVRVAEAYFNTLTAIDALVFARAEERAVKRQLDQAEQRFEVGLTAITDVHEARARYDGARAGTIAAEVQLDDAREALTQIIGAPLENLRGLDENFSPGRPSPEGVDAWVALAMEQNPTLRAQALAAQADELDVNTARAGHLPYLSATASKGRTFGWGSSQADAGVIPSNSEGDDWRVGVNLVVPIFSGFATQTQVKLAINARDERALQYDQNQRAILRQTRNAYRALMAGISEIEARKQAVVSARSALEATEAGFEVGTRTIVDVLLSQQILFQAESAYSGARHNFLVNGLRLKQAAGVIDINDVGEVNRHLVRDAEAALALAEEEGGAG
ncbi:TolC family outer membrane protein [Xanthomonadaceae bacterium JHOS43]|nr:TolC family outer membrane protein [Xanthomonadaceae bacterium JHOS43]MCX7562136.1 TolC family outer membrane protein [Xanthomonadaceae bacterium XH05]